MSDVTISRRKVAVGAAWTAPVVVMVAAARDAAATPTPGPTTTGVTSTKQGQNYTFNFTFATSSTCQVVVTAISGPSGSGAWSGLPKTTTITGTSASVGTFTRASPRLQGNATISGFTTCDNGVTKTPFVQTVAVG